MLGLTRKNLNLDSSLEANPKMIQDLVSPIYSNNQ